MKLLFLKIVFVVICLLILLIGISYLQEKKEISQYKCKLKIEILNSEIYDLKIKNKKLENTINFYKN